MQQAVRHLLPLAMLVVAQFVLAPAHAVTVVQCVDADGNTSFRDTCPPGSTEKGKKKLTGLGGPDNLSMAEIAAENPITMYSVPECDACDLVRNALSGRDIPFTEKDVQDNAEMQEELREASGGLTVPAILVGGRVLTGYSRTAIDSALAEAGYPITPDTAAVAPTEP